MRSNPTTYHGQKEIAERESRQRDVRDDCADVAPLSGKSVFDAICRATDANRADPQRARVEAATRASLVNHITDRRRA